MVKVEERVVWVDKVLFIRAILDQQKSFSCPIGLQWPRRGVCSRTGQYYSRFTGITEDESVNTNKSTQTSGTRSNIWRKKEHEYSGQFDSSAVRFEKRGR